VAPGSAVDLHSRLPFQFSTLTSTTRPWPIVQGTFDQPPMQQRAVDYWKSMRQQIQGTIDSNMKIIRLCLKHGSATPEEKEEIAGELQQLRLNIDTAIQSLLQRRAFVNMRKNQIEALDTTTQQGQALWKQRQEEDDEEEDEEEESDE
jgi:hypothetical protein